MIDGANVQIFLPAADPASPVLAPARPPPEAQLARLERMNPGAGDPILSFLARLPPRRVLLLSAAAVAAGLGPVALAYIEGNLTNPDLHLDMGRDIPYWTTCVLLLPVVLGTLAGYLAAFRRTVIVLVRSRAVLPEKLDAEEFCEWSEGLWSRRWMVVPPYLIGLAVTVVVSFQFVFSPHDTWHSSAQRPNGTAAGWVSILLTAPIFYLVSAAVFRVGSTFAVLSRLFRGRLRVQPLHPDRCGGLRPLGRLSMTLNVLVIAVGVVCAINVGQSPRVHGLSLAHPVNLAIGVGYVIGAAVVFFLPLYSAHASMVSAKDELIGAVNDRFEDLNSQVMEQIRGGGKADMSAVSDLEALDKLHAWAGRMPVYPFNAALLSAFFSSIVVPAAVVLLQVWVASVLGIG